jgi:hypothetical protein
MRGKFAYIVGASGVAVAMLAFVVTIEAEGIAVGPHFDPASVNRTLKGSRLPLVPGTSGAAPVESSRQHSPKSLSACAANAAPKPFAAEVAGRCVV